jgi:carbamoyltransferase
MQQPTESPTVVGINRTQDASIAVARGRAHVASLQKERVSRRKHHWGRLGDLPDRYLPSFPDLRGPVDLVVECFSSDSEVEHLDAYRAELREHLDLRDGARTELVSHHLAHVYSAFFPSPFASSAVLVVDAQGSRVRDVTDPFPGREGADPELLEIASLYACDREGRVECLEKHLWDGDWERPVGLGCFYYLLTRMVFPHGEGNEGKVMGLAPFGRVGSMGLPELEVDETGVHIPDAWIELFAERERYLFPKDSRDRDAVRVSADLAAEGQAAFESALLRLAGHLRERSGLEDLCFAGGAALNCSANGTMLLDGPFRDVFIPPSPHDGGTAVGCALYGSIALLGQDSEWRWRNDFLGPAPDGDEARLEAELRAGAGDDLVVERPDDLLAAAVDVLERGGVVAVPPGAQRVGAARARQPLDHRRRPPPGHAGLHQLQGQGPRVVPAARAARARRARAADLRHRPPGAVHAVRDADPARVRRGVPGDHARGRDGAPADGRARADPVPARVAQPVRGAHGVADPAQHVAQRAGRPAHRDARALAQDVPDDADARARGAAVPRAQARGAAARVIRAFAREPSVDPGGALDLHVAGDEGPFAVTVHRWGAAGLEPVAAFGPFAAQDVPDRRPHEDWARTWPAVRLPVGADWRPGAYVAVLGDGEGGPPVPADARAGRALFVVRPRPGAEARILYKLPLFTYHAYNQVSAEHWTPETGRGGWCLYSDFHPRPEPGPARRVRPPARRRDRRPHVRHVQPRSPPARAAPDVRALGRPDARVARARRPRRRRLHRPRPPRAGGDALLAPHRLLLSAGHDEYWSAPMRDRAEAFTRAGGNAAFLGGNTCWWRIEFAGSDHAYRRAGHWHEAGRPENALTGVSFRNGGERPLGHHGPPVGFRVQHDDHWVLAGTGLRDGDVFGAGRALVGYECDGAAFDRAAPGPARPTGADGTPEDFTILGVGDVGRRRLGPRQPGGHPRRARAGRDGVHRRHYGLGPRARPRRPGGRADHAERARPPGLTRASA